MRYLFSGFLITVVMFFQSGCQSTQSSTEASSISAERGDVSSSEGKTDESNIQLRESDLAIIIPRDRARLLALEVIPEEWLSQVDDALYASELGERISDESWPEDWRLVSLRIAPCSPLGLRADPEEIDRLCWPGVRLVFQPIVERINVFGVIRDTYADDRAIHALYRAASWRPILAQVQQSLAGGAKLATLDPALLAEFEDERDRVALELLSNVKMLRAEALEVNPWERAEFYRLESEERFWRGLSERIIKPYCAPRALHELTAFSLPMGRNPAAADLWSFVAFSGQDGRIEQAPITVHDARDGSPLFTFDGSLGEDRSEDVTTGRGDPALDASLARLDSARRDALTRQVIMDTDQLVTHGARINDPYQTLVPHTTCASCHRANDLDFNFHNLSYFEDHEVTISPRTKADVSHDLWWSTELSKRVTK